MAESMKTRVRVKINSSSDAKESIELDYRLMIAGDFSKKEPGSQGPLKERKVLGIKNKRDFKTVLERINPRVKMTVPNRLVDNPDAGMDVDLDFKDMKDFHPDEIAKKVPALKELMEARERLKRLRLMSGQDPNKLRQLQDLLKPEGGVDKLLSKLSSD